MFAQHMHLYVLFGTNKFCHPFEGASQTLYHTNEGTTKYKPLPVIRFAVISMAPISKRKTRGQFILCEGGPTERQNSRFWNH